MEPELHTLNDHQTNSMSLKLRNKKKIKNLIKHIQLEKKVQEAVSKQSKIINRTR